MSKKRKIAVVLLIVFVFAGVASLYAASRCSVVPVSMYAQNVPDNVVAQAQVKYYSVSVSGSYKGANGIGSFSTTKMYSIRASSSGEARNEAVRRFYSEFPSAYNVRANVLN